MSSADSDGRHLYLLVPDGRLLWSVGKTAAELASLLDKAEVGDAWDLHGDGGRRHAPLRR
ncbi:hypothetical protein [Spirillospora sp. CA-128828]|uniref:hypothetical protein n=1 Tax=Spirillospora sp. CA-128828 TaxID=3240033 RepID=UPI003D8A17C2